MTYNIIVGRDESDRKKFGEAGVVLLGKHYVKMGRTTSLSNPVFLDIVRSHVILVCGKKGSGKSWTLGVISEGISNLPPEIARNACVVIFDTMGVFWTMKYPNRKEDELLREWGMSAKGLDIAIYTPKGYYARYQDSEMPTDFPFSIRPDELTSEDWMLSFGLSMNDPISILIDKILSDFE